jgi:hypothetical protein
MEDTPLESQEKTSDLGDATSELEYKALELESLADDTE